MARDRITTLRRKEAFGVVRMWDQWRREPVVSNGIGPLPDLPPAPSQLVKYGTPNPAFHDPDTQVTYDLWNVDNTPTGEQVSPVYNNTGVQLVSTVKHIILKVESKWLAFPFQLASCTADNPTT